MTITVIVDDNNNAIEYAGNWTLQQPSSLATSSGPGIMSSIGNSLHGFSAENDIDSMALFTYTFTGTSCPFSP